VRDDTLKVTTSKITLEGEVGENAGKYGCLINRVLHLKIQFISASMLTCINYLQDTEFVEYEKEKRGKVINKRNNPLTHCLFPPLFLRPMSCFQQRCPGKTIF
jgi:hypothetical protein